MVVEEMKRSNAPIFWVLFGGGGMLAALFGTMLVFITGIAAPLAWPFGPDLLSYQRVLPFAQNWLGKGFLFAVIALFAWHAAHRIFHSLHDVGIHNGALAKLLCYGSALVATLIAAGSLLRLGF
jgi:fumarate reductase subunit D